MSYETDVALYERDYVKQSHTICQSWTLSSVDVPCVKDVIFKFNAFDRQYFCTLCSGVAGSESKGVRNF